ncbi:MAG: helix-turn-helix domain-containing protein [Bacteroidales bacterium]|nr:helix-turn-helix domain-containing protein [Bacteroidales bacterium]
MKYPYHIFIILFTTIAIAAQAQDVHISAIPNISKLPVNATHRVFQDSEGYLWYGTVDGLCRDDGYNVQVFRSDIFSPGLIADNLIESVAEDTLQRIWFGTDKGAYVLDKRDYSITMLDSTLMSSRIMNIYKTSDGDMWLAHHGWLSRYNTNLKLRKRYPIANNNEPTTIGGFAESRSGDIFITFYGGNYLKYNAANDCFDTLKIEQPALYPSIMIQDRDSNFFWQSTWKQGITKFYPDQNRAVIFPEQKFTVVGMAQNKETGDLWVTTDKELICFKRTPEGGLKQVDFPEDFLPHGHMLVEVHQGKEAMYVSAFDRPCMIIRNDNAAAKHFKLDKLRDFSKVNPAVMALATSNDSIFWIMQERSGLALFDATTGNTKLWYQQPELQDLRLHNGREIATSEYYNGIWTVPDFTRTLYAVTRNGWNMKVVDSYNFDTLTSLTNIITRVYEEGKKLLVGMTSGLYIYDIPSHRIEDQPIKSGYVTDICKDIAGKIWVATRDSGIICMEGNEIQRHMPFAENFTCIAAAPDGRLWLGSADGGLYSLDTDSTNLTPYICPLSLNGDQINKLHVDDFGHVWVAQNYQVIEFNPTNSSYRTYSARDGSTGMDRYLPTAMCTSPHGTIYFGGIPGFMSTQPSNILERRSKNVKTVITDVQVDNESLFFDRKSNYNSEQAITIEPDDINLQVFFSTLNHAEAPKIRFAYILEGYYNDWQYTAPPSNALHISKLPKGKYTLRVKATDENGLWSNEVTTMTIVRRPAFYETWWAYTLYILIAAALIWLAMHKQIRHVEKKNDEQWNDSEEMIRMREYINAEIQIKEPEYLQLDKMIIEKATQIIEENLSEPDFDVTALAENMNMSRSTLTRKLKAITNKTPLELIKDIKMQHASILLGDKDRSVTEIATSLGYYNRKYFTQCFKDAYGMTPSEYRAEKLGKNLTDSSIETPDEE